MPEPEVRLLLGDCLERIREIPDGTVDAIVTDPPYPEIDREYGRMTEVDWHAMMRVVIAESRRVLKPTGSAVFILQPNSERVGRMRPWLWEFMAWTAREWNQVQDVWWWNHSALPQACSITGKLCRPSLKACVWLGSPDCYRDQDAVLWGESEANVVARLTRRAIRVIHPSGHSVNRLQIAMKAVERGGVTPFNVLPIANTDSQSSAGSHGHGAGTPADLCDWWARYIVPDGGTLCDPFMGSGTTGIVAVNQGLGYIGIERHEPYFHIAKKRIDAVAPTLFRVQREPLSMVPPVAIPETPLFARLTEPQA